MNYYYIENCIGYYRVYHSKDKYNDYPIIKTYDGYTEYDLETKQLTPMTEEEFISMIVYSYCYDRYEIIHIKDKFLCIMTVTLYDGLEFYLFSFGIDEIDALQNCLTSKHKYEQLYDEKYDKED